MSTALLEDAVEEAVETAESVNIWLVVAIILAVLVVAGGIAIAIKLPSKNTPVTRIVYCSVSVVVSAGALIMGVYGNQEHAIGEDVYFVIMLGLFAFALIWLNPKTFIYNLLLDIVLGLVLTIVSVFIASYDYGWIPGLVMVVISFICMGYHVRRLIKRNKYIRYQENQLAEKEAIQQQQAEEQAAPRNKRELKQAIMNSTAGTSRQQQQQQTPVSGADFSYEDEEPDNTIFQPPAGQGTPVAAEAAEEQQNNDTNTDSKDDDTGLDLDIDPFGDL